MIYYPRASQSAGWRLITPPTSEILDLAAVKQQLRVTHTAEDDYLESLIPMAREYIEARDHILATQVWEMLLDAFPAEGITIWKNPVQSVDLINYVDTDGTTQTWSTDDYRVIRTGRQARVELVTNASWPSTQYQSEAVTVRFTAGYAESPPSIPKMLIHAMKLFIGHFYIHREAVTEDRAVELPMGLETLIGAAIANARVY